MYSSAVVEIAGKLDSDGIEDRNEVVEYQVCDIFVVVPLVAEGPEVQLERFKLDTVRIGDVGDSDRREIGLTRDRAHRSELWADVFDFIGAVAMGIGEHLECPLVLTGHTGLLGRVEPL
jgi:hypothetical protein